MEMLRDVKDIVTYTISPGVYVHPKCYIRECIAKRERWISRYIMTVWYENPTPIWKCAICGEQQTKEETKNG